MAIVTDSAASLPADVAAELGITVVPLRIVVGGVDQPDGGVPLEDVVARIGEGTSTSAPSPGEFARAVNGAMTPDGALVATVASTMSATFAAAEMAAELVEGDVRIVDTGTAAGAEGLVVLAAAARAAAGAGLDEVEATARRVADRVRLVASVDGLDYLVRSGRVPGIAGWAGRRLGLHPLFEFTEGKVRRLLPATSAEAARRRMVDRVEQSRQSDGEALHLAVLHALAAERADQLLADLTERVGRPATSFVGEFSTVLVSHTGPLVGVAWWWDDGVTG